MICETHARLYINIKNKNSQVRTKICAYVLYSVPYIKILKAHCLLWKIAQSVGVFFTPIKQHYFKNVNCTKSLFDLKASQHTGEMRILQFTALMVRLCI